MIAILYINQLNPLVTLKNSNLIPLIKPLKNKSRNPKYLIDEQVKESQARKAKKPKGLNPKKKKKARKQGNMK